MRRTILGPALVLALLLSGSVAGAQPVHQGHHRHGCAKLFTVRMGERAARAIEAGTRHVSLHGLRVMGYIERCQRNPAAQAFVRGFDRRQAAAHAARVWSAQHPYSTAFVSQYDDAGTHCCGVYAKYGVADCGSGGGPCYPQGTQIEFCLHGCVVATVDDHGPYVKDREFDLANSTADAIGFSGIGDVYWRLR